MTAIAERLEALASKLIRLLAVRDRRATTNAPPRPSVGACLDRINDDFHAEYGRASARVQYDFPVFVLLADSLVVFHAGQRREFSFSPRAFHIIKSIAHAPVALFVALQSVESRKLDLLADMQRRVDAALDLPLDDEQLSATARNDLTLVLRSSRECIDAALSGGTDQAQLDALAARLGEPLRRLLHEATALQLHALHEHTESALRPLSPHERCALRVVVTGDHQARVRSFAMQYFKKRMSLAPNVDAQLTYAEGVSDEQAALELVGVQQLDRKLARAFFGEEARLQRDLLGDAAEELLRSFPLAPLA